MPVFERSPLTASKCLPLRPASVRPDCREAALLLKLLRAEPRLHEEPVLWEGLIRLAAMQGESEDALVALILKRQAENGSFGGDPQQEIAAARALFAAFETEPKQELLRPLMAWCARLHADWRNIASDPWLHSHPADLAELLVQLYRAAGAKPLTGLLESLRRAALAWDVPLHAFDTRSAVHAADGGTADASADPVALADGARAALTFSVYSGNGHEREAAETGWKRISRWHGQPNGGITGLDTLGGSAPDAPVKAETVGAWLEAFAAQMQHGSLLWAADAMEALLVNAVPALVADDGIRLTDACNRVKRDAPKLPEKDRIAGLARLSRGVAAALCSAVCVTPNGAALLLPLSGKAAFPVKESRITIEAERKDGLLCCTVRAKEEIRADLRVRIPAWMEGAELQTCGEAFPIAEAGLTHLDRTWRDGDIITLAWHESLRTAPGYHQSVSVYRGAVLLAARCDAMKELHVAACGEPAEKKGRTVLPVKAVDGPAKAMPVRPAVKGKASDIDLVPYAETTVRIAAFPVAAS